jgi:hypothetical protein
MRVLGWLLVLTVTLGATSCRGGRLFAIGLDASGRVIAAAFNQAAYERRLENALIEVNDSVHTAVQGYAQDPDDDFELQLIAIGVNLRAELGFGPFKLGLVPGLRAFFTNVDNPPPLP